MQLNSASENVSETLKGMVPLKCNLIYTYAHALACPHVCANMCPVTSEGILTVPAVLYEGLAHTQMLLEWIHT